MVGEGLPRQEGLEVVPPVGHVAVVAGRLQDVVEVAVEDASIGRRRHEPGQIAVGHDSPVRRPREEVQVVREVQDPLVGGPNEEDFNEFAQFVAGPSGPVCLADFDGSGEVGFSDLTQLLSQWGPCPSCPEDLDGDGVVGFSDLTHMLSKWGPC